jgi:hypothetical protein
MDTPSREQIVAALQAAAAAHHDYQANALHGVHDEQWHGWYAAYVLGRLGDFVTPTVLANWLSASPGSDDWSSSAADYVEERLAAP